MATSIRLPDPLKTDAAAYAERIGISLNALVAVALADYLTLRADPGRVATLPAVATTPMPSVAHADDTPSTQPAPVVSVPKPGRNDPCPCGSGRKYKVCCGR